MNSDSRFVLLTVIEETGLKLVRARENIVRAAAKSKYDREIIESAGYVVTDEEIEYVKDRDEKRNSGSWSILDELKSNEI